MQYTAFIYREAKYILAEFPDCPGCQTFAEGGDELASAAHEALEGWLEAHLVGGQIPPRPVDRKRAPEGKKIARISVRPGLAAALLIRWARDDAGLTQRQLGVRAGVTQQQIAKLEDPDENPTLETLEKVGKALGLDVTLGFEATRSLSLPSPVRRRSSSKR